MTTDLSAVPLRQLLRLRSEFSIATTQFAATLFPDQPMLGVEFGIAARVCLPDWTDGLSLARPVAPSRTIPLRKIALSLGRARETTRRNVNLLVDRGAFTVSPRGVSLAATAENEALVMRYYLSIHDRFLRLIEDFSVTCDVTFPVGETPVFGLDDVIGRGLDIALLPIDTFRPIGVKPMPFLLWAAMTVIAVRDVTYDPVLSRLYANAIPPDTLRKGISLRKLAALMSVPYASAWRYMQALQAAGLVTRLGNDEWIVLTQNLLVDSLRGIGTSPDVLLFNRLRELALMGLVPERAGEYYRIGRPDLAATGDDSCAMI